MGSSCVPMSRQLLQDKEEKHSITVFQNITFTSDAYETGDAIMAGYNVCPEHSIGDVNITNGAHVILDGESDVLLDKRVTVELGSSLEVR